MQDKIDLNDYEDIIYSNKDNDKYYILNKKEDYEKFKHGKYFVTINNECYEYFEKNKEGEKIIPCKKNQIKFSEDNGFYSLDYKGNILEGYNFNENIFHIYAINLPILEDFIFVKSLNKKKIYCNGIKVNYFDNKMFYKFNENIKDKPKIIPIIKKNISNMEKVFNLFLYYDLIEIKELSKINYYELNMEIINDNYTNMDKFDFTFLEIYLNLIYMKYNKYKYNYYIYILHENNKFNKDKFKEYLNNYNYVFLFLTSKYHAKLYFFNKTNVYYYDALQQDGNKEYSFDRILDEKNYIYGKISNNNNCAPLTGYFIMKIIKNNFNPDFSQTIHKNISTYFRKYFIYQLLFGITSEHKYLNNNLHFKSFDDLIKIFNYKMSCELEEKSCFLNDILKNNLLDYISNKFPNAHQSILDNYIKLMKTKYKFKYYNLNSNFDINIINLNIPTLFSSIKNNHVFIYLLINNKLFRFDAKPTLEDDKYKTINAKIKIDTEPENKIISSGAIKPNSKTEQNKFGIRFNDEGINNKENCIFLACLYIRYLVESKYDINSINGNIKKIYNNKNDLNLRGLIIKELLEGKLEENIFGADNTIKYIIDENFIEAKYK